ncbi:MAG: metallophosphoesterase [Bacteroidetes bacterium]|nr:metallophosphoesterase [Bacteroidota bacterium]MCW5894037.1 metallophosphoesterase [Bacteroidota bacterium]
MKRNTRFVRLWRLLIFAAIPLVSSAAQGQHSIRFAAVGDFPSDSSVQAVADMISSWNPDFIITVGDNNYVDNDTSIVIWDNEVGRFYGQYIRYPQGSPSMYAPGSPENRFFPTLGNHDWRAGIEGWYNYFELPGNERYYSFVKGPVHFFAVDSDSAEPDGITSTSMQALWLQQELTTSAAQWKVVFFHHPPYTSSVRPADVRLRWPFKEWGAHVVLAGHEHHYERIVYPDFPYFVNGSGGRQLKEFISNPIVGSMVRYNANHGAMLITADQDSMVFEFHSVEGGGTLVDRYRIRANEIALLPVGSVWKYLDDNSDQGTAWRMPEFNDTSWASGPARLGFGDDGEITEINAGPPGNRHITTYFRHAFDISDPSVVLDLVVDVLRDDGAVVYLNGTEVFRTNMPAGTIAHSTLAVGLVSGDDENIFYTASINPSVLVAGRNVLAVEVHQYDIASNDLGFDLRLVALLNHNPVPVQLGSFSAGVIEPGVVRLEWTTLSETNNYGFEIQKSPDTPTNFFTIPNSFTPGHGTTLEPRFYRFTDQSTQRGTWFYRLKQIDLDGRTHYFESVRVDLVTTVEERSPLSFMLDQNYPNPLNPQTRIVFEIPDRGHVTLRVFNTLGQEVRTLVEENLPSGRHEVLWDGRDKNGLTVPSGVYFYRLNTGENVTVKKMSVVR